MYICICNAITDKQIRQAAEAGVSNLWQLQAELGVATNCGSCGDQAAAIIQETRAGRPPQPRIYQPVPA